MPRRWPAGCCSGSPRALCAAGCALRQWHNSGTSGGCAAGCMAAAVNGMSIALVQPFADSWRHSSATSGFFRYKRAC